MTPLSKREQNRMNKQSRILDAAIKVFSQAGYSHTSMDRIAAEAGITKPTLYQYYPSKDILFRTMMAAHRDVIMLPFESAGKVGLVEQLIEFAWAYADTVMRPDFLSLARLIIGEAHRFPDIGREYQESGPDKVLEGLMGFLERHRAQGALDFEDAELAAQDFWGLILSAPRNRALHIPDEQISHEKLARYVHNGIRVFLLAYSTNPESDLLQLTRSIAKLKVENDND
ncbi:TetR/AcrR family transcriptional regulator [Planktotalea sp.]|uniref:TetR/AcrR family transcriptional regulator n=1 Tax=Planktotalea sp. TaxID=2029877 RepID=UPI003D6A4CC8